eukprot:sb/3475046/
MTHPLWPLVPVSYNLKETEEEKFGGEKGVGGVGETKMSLECASGSLTQPQDEARWSTLAHGNPLNKSSRSNPLNKSSRSPISQAATCSRFLTGTMSMIKSSTCRERYIAGKRRTQRHTLSPPWDTPFGLI